MKHILKVIEEFDFNHNGRSTVDSIIGFDFEKSQKLVDKSAEFNCSSKRIEYIMFGNTENLKNRMMAIYGLGLITGARAVKSIQINIKKG